MKYIESSRGRGRDRTIGREKDLINQNRDQGASRESPPVKKGTGRAIKKVERRIEKREEEGVN